MWSFYNGDTHCLLSPSLQVSEGDKHTEQMSAMCNRDVGVGGTLSSLGRFLGEGRKKRVRWPEGQKRQGLVWGVQVIQCSWSIKQKEVYCLLQALSS